MTSIHMPDPYLWESIDVLYFISEDIRSRLHEKSIHEVGALLSCSPIELERLVEIDAQGVKNIEKSLAAGGMNLGESGGWLPGTSYAEAVKQVGLALDRYFSMRNLFEPDDSNSKPS